jgi:hypothetical protein
MENFKYQVRANGPKATVDANFYDWNDACDFYSEVVNDFQYNEGYVMDNRTGEIYAHFEHDECGTQV